jgi:hypothetical protein
LLRLEQVRLHPYNHWQRGQRELLLDQWLAIPDLAIPTLPILILCAVSCTPHDDNTSAAGSASLHHQCFTVHSLTPQDSEANAKNAVDREAEIATGNPLLNLQAALGQTPGTPGTPGSTATSTATFAVKRRWDDDLIFKNQAAGIDDKPKKGEFVNDLLRSEFHKKFMLK